MQQQSRSELRALCDDYMDPRDYICGGGRTEFHVHHLVDVRDKAKTVLNFYNKKKRKNFVLKKVVKLNFVFGAQYCMTFWAQEYGNDKPRLFRGVYSLGNVLLCEIKDCDHEITIPASHNEPGPFEIEKDDFYQEWIPKAPDVCDLCSEDDEDGSEDGSEDEYDSVDGSEDEYDSEDGSEDRMIREMSVMVV